MDRTVQCHQESGRQLRQVSASSGHPCLLEWIRIVKLLTGQMLVMQELAAHIPLAALVISQLKALPDYSSGRLLEDAVKDGSSKLLEDV